ncbi:DUF4260 family protein [Mesorhizobium sp. B2-4-15]|uniref:DUF4260 family protein n=1 Tax=Mesorhizobium sp. B2-4-15 TaxID=2589934 RepID=UPI0032B19DFB
MKPLDLIVRLEWAVVTMAAVVFYGSTGVSWWLFGLLILAPDLSMLGYLGGPSIGAIAYNALHIVIVPGCCCSLVAWSAMRRQSRSH